MNWNKRNINIAHLLKAEPDLFSVLKPGDLIEGAILGKKGKNILVDLGAYGTGAVYSEEIKNAWDIVKNLKVGDKVYAKVLEEDNEDGYVELSLAEADKQKVWLELIELAEKNEPFSVKITGFNKKGLLTKINGVSAFLPLSQLAGERYKNISPRQFGRTDGLGQDNQENATGELEKLVGEEILIKIIDLNPRFNKLIISEKEAVEISKGEMVKNYEVGQVVEGIVSGLADFGVFVRFVDNPAMEGLIHISELNHRIVENPKEVVGLDQVVKVKIIEIKDDKISLSLKALTEDPWLKVNDVYKEETEVKGRVYSFNPFGAIINLDFGLQGQIHITDFGSEEEMKRHLKLSEEYQFFIKSIKPREKRIILNLKN